MADPAIVAQAREWIDRVDAGTGLSGNWRLQVIQKRFRQRRDGEGPVDCSDACTGLPMRIRRFVPGCPWALVDQAIRYLICKAPYTGIVYNGLRLDGTYRPTNTMWTRDEQSSVDEQRPQNGTYTLIQDLIEDGCEDTDAMPTGASCSYEETTEYHWDDKAPAELPGCGCGDEDCQGVTRAVQAINRKEDGTFDYQVVTRRARTQHAGPFEVECGCDGVTTVETWDNVYGARGAFRTDPMCGSRPVEFQSCSADPGLKIQVTVTQNQDCTYKIQVVRRTSDQHHDSWRDGTACQRRTTTAYENQRAMPDVGEPAVGETVQASFKRNDDCTYSGTVTVVKAADPYGFSWKDGTSCRERIVTVLKDQRERPVPPEIGKGEVLDAQITRNADCTWDAQFSVRKPAKAEVLKWRQGSGCRTQDVTRYVSSAYAPHVPDAGVGETVSAEISRNEDCTYDGRVTVEKAPDPVVVKWTSGTPCRPVENTVGQNLRTEPTAPELAAGKTVEFRKTRNPDCTWDVQSSVAETAEFRDSWDEGSACRRVNTVTMTGVKDYRSVIPAVPATGSMTVRVQRNQDCTFDVSYSVASAQSPVSESWSDGSVNAPRTVTVSQHMREKPGDPAAPGTGETVRWSLQKNEDCTWTSSKEVVRARMTEVEWTDDNCDRKTETKVVRNSPVRPAKTESYPDGTSVSREITENADGTFDYRETRVTGNERDSGGVVKSWDSGDYKITHYVYYNKPEPQFPKKGEVKDTDPNVSISCRFTLNQFCRYDGEYTVTQKVRNLSSRNSAEGYIYGPIVGDWKLQSVYRGAPRVNRGRIEYPVDVTCRCHIYGAQKLKYVDEYMKTLSEASGDYGNGELKLVSFERARGYAADEERFFAVMECTFSGAINQDPHRPPTLNSASRLKEGKYAGLNARLPKVPTGTEG